jgi:pilus assembly protein Flp/PilA
MTRLIRDNDGVTGIEYGLLATLIAVAAVIMMGTVGTKLSSTFDTVASSLVAPPPSPHARDRD